VESVSAARADRLDGTAAARKLHLPVAAATLGIVAISARFDVIGADARWLAALGRVIVAHHSIPSSVPFAAAPSAHFPNVLALAEIIFYGLEKGLGDRGLMLAQLLAVAIALTVLARDALADGATDGGVVAALGIAMVGALPSFAIARVQLFSLALFPILVALLRSEARRPSWRIWLVLPLIALWANLHGAVLIGLGIAWCYLLFSRLRVQRATALLVAGLSALAVCLTPALTETVSYFHLGLTNVGVQRGFGLWSPLSLNHPLDDVLIAAAVVMAVGLRRRGPALWELAALLALAAATIDGSRNGIWLLLFLVASGAQAFRFKRGWSRLVVPTMIVALVLMAFSIAQGPLQSGASRAVVARAVRLAQGTPVLAPDIVAEQVALAGGRVWLSNPLEAFSRHDQAVYIDWSQGLPSGRAALTNAIDVVLVTRGSDQQKLMDRMHGFVATYSDTSTTVYVRRRLGTGQPKAR
jgi:hypothetical protein